MRPVRLVRLAAIVFAVLGLIGVYFGWPGERWLLVGGVVLLVLAPMVWLGVRFARIPAAIVALLASWPLVYGLWGLTVVAGDYGRCSDGATASLVFSSLPAGYCETTDWLRQFGVGFGLIGIGLAALYAFWVVVSNGEYFQRPLRLAR